MWPNPQFSVELVTFTEEVLNGKLHFLCSESRNKEQHDVTKKGSIDTTFFKGNPKAHSQQD